MIGSTMAAFRSAKTPRRACICSLIRLPPWSSSKLCGQEPSRPFVFEGVSRCVIESSFDIPFHNPVEFVTVIDVAIEGGDTVHGLASRAEAVGAVQEVAFPDWF